MSIGNYASDSMISDQMNDKENQDETRLSFENPAKKKKGLQFDWKQSNDSIDVTFKLDNLQITPEDAQRVDVTFSNSDVNVQFPNGNKWYCEFRHPVEAQNGKVFVKKNKIVLHVKKKEMILWADLQASPTPSRSTSGINLDDLQSLSPDSELSSQTLISPSSGIGTTFNEMSSTNSDDPISLDLSPEDENKKESDDAESLQDGEDEKLFDLTHAKHDFIEKEENIIVHVYIKEIKKDLLKVHFGEKQLHLLFQTKSEKFLKMHDGSTEDTTFSWKINLANEIIPDGCKYRLTNSFIEVTLAKSMKKRWGILEATLRKEGTQSTCWIPLAAPSNPSTTTPAITISPPEAGAQGHLAFDDLANVSVRKQELDSENRASAEMGASGVRKDSNSHKPMCKVSPMNKNIADMCVTPGFTGLDNLGNTCFMNSVLQCLGNTREFRDYFLSSKFQRDINQDNPLGMGGKLAVTFAVLLRVLWSGKHYSYAPSKLKNLISQKASQFTGFAQHDAQEFMAFLLDGLHEDVNRIKKKPYTETVDSDGRPDEVVADEAWEVYKKRNDSFIVDLLQGQYKSKLTCPVCGKISITFDPFLYLSLPLPKKKRYLPVIFFWRDPLRKPVQIGLRLPKDCTTEMVKEEASKQTGVSPKSMRIFEAYKGRIYKFYGKGTDFSGVQPNDVIIISEVLTEEMAGEAVYELYVIQRTLMPNQPPTRCSSCRKPCQDGYKLKRCTKCYKVGYCDHNCQKTHWSLHKLHCKLSPDPVGHPFILSIPESHATFSKLCSLMEAYSRYSVDVFQPPIKPDSKHQRINQSSPLSEISSNSSQSSGSISSLDSQSTCSSSCTLTGDQIILNELKSGDDNEQESAACSSSLETQVGESSTNIEQKLGSCYQQSDSSTSVINTVPHISPSDVELGCEVEVQDTYRERTQDMGAVNLPEYSSFKMPSHMRSDNLQRLETDESSGDSNSSSDVEKGNGSSVPMKPVLGIQSGDTDRQVPLFYIKPVNQEGMGIKGPEGTRLEDEGDTALDLSYRQYLSMDWINNEKCDNYVLVQSKDLEYEEDSGLSANSEENTNLTIHHCLKLFTDPEVLTPEEAWYCPQCKEHRQATKHITIWRLPHTLIIQLKRFSFRNFIWRDKIDKLVEFPTRELDLSSYCLDVKQSSTPPLYDLYGVVNHYGGILGGHYTSFVRCADLLDPRVNDVDWRLCDDSRVTSIGSEKNAVTRGAYLLFYRQREPFKLLKCPSSNAELIEENKNNSQTLDNNVLNQDDLVEEKETVYEKVTKEIEEEYVNLEYRVDGYKSESEFSGFTKFDSSKQYEKGASLIYDSSQHYADSDVQKVPTREESSKLAYTDMEDVD